MRTKHFLTQSYRKRVDSGRRLEAAGSDLPEAFQNSSKSSNPSTSLVTSARRKTAIFLALFIGTWISLGNLLPERFCRLLYFATLTTPKRANEKFFPDLFVCKIEYICN